MKVSSAVLASVLLASPMLANAQSDFVTSLNIPDRPESGLEARLEAASDNGAAVVVGVVDSGINPYHQRFQRRTEIPSAILNKIGIDLTCTLTPAFPGDDLAALLDADFESCWSKITEGMTVHFTGTSIVGHSPIGSVPDVAINGKPIRIYDSNGHGSACASAVLNGNNEAVILSVHNFANIEANLFLENNPAVDVISQSWGAIFNLPVAPVLFGSHAVSTRNMVSQGKINIGACGNEASRNCVESLMGGTPWTIGVTGSDTQNKGKYYAASAELPDFVSDFTQTLVTVNTANEYRNWGGTSFSTPVSAGVIAAVIQLARDANCDFGRTGPSADGYLVQDINNQGVLGNTQVRNSLQNAAYYFGPLDFDPAGLTTIYPSLPVLPGTEPAFLGWGELWPTIEETILNDALNIEPLPARPAQATLSMQILMAYREAYWAITGAPVPPLADRDAELEASQNICGAVKSFAANRMPENQSEANANEDVVAQSSASSVTAGVMGVAVAALAAVAALL